MWFPASYVDWSRLRLKRKDGHSHFDQSLLKELKNLGTKQRDGLAAGVSVPVLRHSVLVEVGRFLGVKALFLGCFSVLGCFRVFPME